MATVLESLKGINAYPIPLRTLVDAAEYRGLDMTVEVSQEIMQTAKYKLAQADLLLWLSLAPDVTQAVSYCNKLITALVIIYREKLCIL